MAIKRDYLVSVLATDEWQKFGIYGDYDLAVMEYLKIAREIAEDGLGAVKLEMREEDEYGTAYDCLHYFSYQDFLHK